MSRVDPRLGRRTPGRRRTLLGRAVVVAVGLVLFAIGIAFGMALQDRPAPGGIQTFVRTLEPLPQSAP